MHNRVRRLDKSEFAPYMHYLTNVGCTKGSKFTLYAAWSLKYFTR